MFAWVKTRSRKVLKPPADRSWIEREFQVTRLLHGATYLSPAVFDIVELDGGPDRTNESTVLRSAMLSWPTWGLESLARGMAELHAAIHSV